MASLIAFKDLARMWHLERRQWLTARQMLVSTQQARALGDYIVSASFTRQGASAELINN